MRKLFIFIFTMLFCELHAGDIIIPRLSPLPTNIDKVELSGTWMFSSDFSSKSSLKPIEVPGEWVMQGFTVKKGEAAGYFRTFDVPSSWKGNRIKLRCNGIYSKSIIYINGKEAGSHLGGFTAFEIDVTDFVSFGKQNDIAVSVTSETIADSTSNASRYAVHPLGGISRDIYLFALPEVNISSFHASTTFDSLYKDAKLNIEAEITSEVDKTPKDLALKFTLKDTKGVDIPLKNSVVTINSLDENEKIKISFDVKSPLKWDSEHPNLYTLTAEIVSGNKTIEKSARRIGFRQIEVRGNEMYINNHPIKLRGVCRHEVHPSKGRSLPKDIWEKDVQIFREGNVNYIRTSHYPPDEALLEACDELGMLVELEAPFCWAHEAKVNEKDHYAVLVNQHIEMVNIYRTHPSVIIWSLGNESNLYNEYFKRSGEIIQQIDSTRPRIFSQWGPDADNNELEIGNHHYPGPSGPDTYRNAKRPIVFDEYCHLNAYNRLELSADPALRDKWGELLSYMWDDMYYSKGVLGGAIWAGIDDTFFLPGEKAVGYGTWGPIDGWRRAKPEYWGMKKSYSPVKIALKGNIDEKGNVYFDVENRHLFSNLSECKIKWSAGNSNGVVSPNIAPREKGEFQINIPRSLLTGKDVYIEVIGVRGFTVDEYRFNILPVITAEKENHKYDIQLSETSDFYNINVNNITHTVNKNNGFIGSSNNLGEKLIVSGAQLMLLPLNGEGRGIQMLGTGQNFDPYNPTCENWIASSIKTEKYDDKVIITVLGEYKEAKGYFTYTFSNDGTLVTSYDFTVKQSISPRQTGVVFTLTDKFNKLKWDRTGFWSAYPENHISALNGEATLFIENTPVSSLAGPSKEPKLEWAFDQTDSGSNIFRSTKEGINSVALSTANGVSVNVTSDGTQHSRSWKEGNNVKLLIADYNNGGSDTYLISHAEKQYKKLNPGDKVSGSVCISF